MRTGLSVRVCSILGIPIRVHLLLPALAVVLVVTTPGYTQAEVLLALLSFFAVMLLSTLGHELGHALVARRLRLRAHGILLWPLGGQTTHDRARSPGAHLRVAVAGVAVNLLLAALAGAAVAFRDGAPPGLPRLAAAPDLLLSVWNLNLALAVLNLLPGLPFDGGSALEGLLWARFGRPRARMVVLGTGAVIGAGLVLGGIANENLLLAAVGGWGLMDVARLWREFRERGLEDEALLGVYDFSEGYTTLEAAEGMDSLTGDERAFLDEESRRLRARNRGKSPTRP